MTSPKSRPLWVGTSWKMNKTLAEADSFVDELLTYPIPSDIQPFVLPPHTALARVRDRMAADSPVLLGAQNAHWAAERVLDWRDLHEDGQGRRRGLDRNRPLGPP